jgi:membrane carboxypeptidase/penicillin-binding protein
MPEQQQTARELATVLAALRHWQTALPEIAEAYADIATDGGRLEPLNVDEIDDFCRRLVFGEAN